MYKQDKKQKSLDGYQHVHVYASVYLSSVQVFLLFLLKFLKKAD